MMKKLSFVKLLPLATLLLTACTITTDQSPTDNVSWDSHQQQVKQITQYQTRGSFAYFSGRQKVYARFFWQQDNPEAYRLLLNSPFGSTVMELNVQPGMVLLIDDKGQRYISDDAEKMIQDMTGMAIPLNSLRQWILGLPGEQTQIKLNQQNRLAKIETVIDGKTWVVDYQSYNSAAIPLPNRLELIQGDERIKLKMDNWTLQ